MKKLITSEICYILFSSPLISVLAFFPSFFMVYVLVKRPHSCALVLFFFLKTCLTFLKDSSHIIIVAQLLRLVPTSKG